MIFSPTVGVIIPNYNDEAYVADCYTNIAGQTVPFDQIIFVDDCSVDDSVNVIKNCFSSFQNFELIEFCQNKGTLSAINAGLEACDCDYVLFLSVNDCIFKDLVETFKTTLSSNVGVWSALCLNTPPSGNGFKTRYTPVISSVPTYYSPLQVLELVDVYTNWYVGTTMFFNTSLVKRHNGLSLKTEGLADWLLALVLSLENGCIFVPKILGAVRIHSFSYLETSIMKNSLIQGVEDYFNQTSITHLIPLNLRKKIICRIKLNRFLASFKNTKSKNIFVKLFCLIRLFASVVSWLWINKFNFLKLCFAKYFVARKVYRKFLSEKMNATKTL